MALILHKLQEKCVNVWYAEVFSLWKLQKALWKRERAAWNIRNLALCVLICLWKNRRKKILNASLFISLSKVRVFLWECFENDVTIYSENSQIFLKNSSKWLSQLHKIYTNPHEWMCVDPSQNDIEILKLLHFFYLIKSESVVVNSITQPFRLVTFHEYRENSKQNIINRHQTSVWGKTHLLRTHT